LREHHQRTNLIVFLAVLTTGVVLIAMGVLPESLATIAVGLSSLYAAWNSQEPNRRRGAQKDERTPGD
jgi:cation transport ATPase